MNSQTEIGLVEIIRRCANVDQDVGLATARQQLRELFQELDIQNEIKQSIFLTLLDELGNNILRHGGEGTICLTGYKTGSRVGIRMVAEDRGGGIKDLAKALRPGYSEDNGLGRGLNLLESLADDVRIASLIGGGTYVEVWKWA